MTITFYQLLGKVKKKEAPQTIIIDNIVYRYVNGNYVDRFKSPLEINLSIHEMVTSKIVEVM